MIPSKISKKIPESVYSSVCSGIESLTPPQEMAVLKGLFSKDILVSSPTASGKTLIAEMSFAKTVLEDRMKAVYIVPLRSLASEKYNDFKQRYGEKIRVMLSTGDIDSSDDWLSKADIIVTTSEKMDSLIRHEAQWLEKIGVLIVDEVHMIGDPSRGATLEVLITRLKMLNPKMRFLGLSATVKNSDELASWLGANLVSSDYRPVKLYEGVISGGEITFPNKTVEITSDEKDDCYSLVKDAYSKNKQCIVFVSSRKRAENLASKLKLKSTPQLEKLSSKILKALARPTEQCEKLSRCTAFGTAFHHAGLVQKQKQLLENAFRNGELPVIFATPTLAMGVDLPAFRVIIRDLKRFGNGYSDWISVNEYKQLAGRAGRPKYSDYGEAISVVTPQSKQAVIDRFIHGEVEDIYSQLGAEPNLRTHMLSLICQSVVRKEDDIMLFFKKTFYAHQYKDLSEIDSKIRRILDQLESWNFIKYEGSMIVPTKFGLRISQLYLDPRSARTLMQAASNAREKGINDIGLLHACSMTSEAMPLLNLRQDDYIDMAEDFSEDREKMLLKEPSPQSYEAYNFMRAYKTARMIESWIDEKTEQEIMREYGSGPGDIRNRTVTMDWLLFSMKELSLLMDEKPLLIPISNLRVRVRHGIRAELLPLIMYRGIGRVRARLLFVSGIRTTRELRKANFEILKRLLGPRTAQKLKDQVERRTLKSNDLNTI